MATSSSHRTSARTPTPPPALAWQGVVSLVALAPMGLQANPAGLTVQSGSASAVASGSQLTITAGNNAFLNWQSFNIGAGETTRFIQPSASSIVWNNIQDRNPSSIWGNLIANGTVVLINPSGFYFGPNAKVDAAGLIVSTAPIAPSEAGAGMFWQFSGPPPLASIVNYGQLNAGAGGSLFLIAEKIENHGTLSAPAGSIGLVSGQEVLLSERPDGRGLSANVRLPSGAVDNSGRILADAGTIALHAKTVNQNGVVEANTVRQNQGFIEFLASDSIQLGADSVTRASGGTGSDDGGRIEIKSAGTYSDAASARVEVRSGATGGNGGHVEISAPLLPAIRATVDGTASAGGRGGRFLIDPQDIVLNGTGTGSAGSGIIQPSDPPAGTLTLNVNSAFAGFSEIHLQATRNITVAAGTVWDLATSTGVGGAGFEDAPAQFHLTLEAGNNLTVANGASIVAGGGWTVSLVAGRDFAQPGALKSGTGNLTLGGTGAIESRNGNISLLAGNNISVGSGYVRTTAGGSIEAEARAGSINTGTRANGFIFRPTGYLVDPDLGGISTAHGGNVSLTAGLDVTSFLPIPGPTQTDGGSGAFGVRSTDGSVLPRPGNVTINAGRDVAGHFVIASGSGTIRAGRDAGTASRLLALSVIDGGWDVRAGRDILLQEVRNPNGIFNNLGFGRSETRHLFDYTARAYTFLDGGNAVELRGTGLPRYNDAFEQGITPIYPGILTIRSGAGGVLLGNDVTLFPSPDGNLQVTTTSGGSLVGGRTGDLTQFLVSDSDKKQYREFGDFSIADRAATPVHIGDTKPRDPESPPVPELKLSISGNISGILLAVPKRAEIRVGGNWVNSRFDGQNLASTDVTLLKVDGDIVNRNEFTSVQVAVAPDFSLFDLAYPALSGTVTGFQSQFTYSPTTRRLTFQGRMTGEQLQVLKGLSVQKFDANGAPIFLPNGEPATHIVSVLPAEIADALYTGSQDVSLNPDTGYRIGGGGLFDIQARNVDLGATVGIVSQGPRGNAALARYFTRGADIRLTLGGNLEMFSTKIASLNGGNIDITADGHINVGSKDFQVGDAFARGIFTVDPSRVTVVARGDININGSRIAAYDGGNVSVTSLTGSVDAGSGGGGAATVEKIVVDPQTRAILSYSPTIPGSGILATTFPPSLGTAFPPSINQVGNILVETPNGDIRASSGGVVQLPLNGIGSNIGTVTLRAGTRDAAGNTVLLGSIDASGSGVIGSSVKLEATGDIKGLVFARENIDLVAQQSVNVTALAQGNVSVSAGGNISGTIIGVSGVSAAGSAVDAALLSQNVTTSGDASGSQVGFTQGNAAGSASQSLQRDDESRTAATGKSKAETDEDRRNRVAAAPRITRTVGRVTVLLK